MITISSKRYIFCKNLGEQELKSPIFFSCPSNENIISSSIFYQLGEGVSFSRKKFLLGVMFLLSVVGTREGDM